MNEATLSAYDAHRQRVCLPPTQNAPAGDPNAPGYFKHIELEINTVCNTACHGCDRFSDVAARGVPNMTVAQVARFVDESLALDWEWERIRVLGGEPTLHPQLREIICVLLNYRTRYPRCFLQVLTNGIAKGDGYRAWLAGNGVDLHTEAKTKGKTPAFFVNTRIVPLDRDPNCGALEPCGIFGVRGCGIALTRHGYFLDGAGASIARVAGHDIGCRTLAEVTYPRMLEQAKVLCCRCGHWNPGDGSTVTQKVTETGEVTGAFWQETLAMYHRQQPVLKVYGDA